MQARFRYFPRALPGRRPRRLRRRAPAAAPAPAKAPCANPNALGIARVVEIDTTGGPGFGFEHFKQLDFLRDHEVVLTFDDGPWPLNTPSVLKTLAEECTTGIFFPIGKHSTYYPEILKQVGRGRPHHRIAHLVARDPHQQETDRRPAQGRDRKGFQRGEVGPGRARPRRSSASRRCSIRRKW